MNTAKRLAMAAGAFLQYEFACQRDTLFNERSVVTPISNVLKAVYKHDVHTEFLHPVLAPLKSGPGRRPEVDFAVVQKYPEIICAVETKWVGAAGIKMEDLLWLANCYFAHDSSGFLVLLRPLRQTRMIKSGTTWRSAKKLLKELELRIRAAVVGPNGPIIKSEPVWRWL